MTSKYIKVSVDVDGYRIIQCNAKTLHNGAIRNALACHGCLTGGLPSAAVSLEKKGEGGGGGGKYKNGNTRGVNNRCACI